VSCALVSPVQTQTSGCGIRDDGLITNAEGKWMDAGASAQSDDYAEKSRNKPLLIFEMRRAAPDSNVCDGTLAPPLPDTSNPKTEQGCPTDDGRGETEVQPWNRRLLVRRSAFDVRHIRQH
jgi:hypothetical protein